MILSKRLIEYSKSQKNENDCFVFFDFDGTLTTKDSLMPFLKFCVGSFQYYLKLLVISPVLVMYLIGLLANDKAKVILLKYFLGGWHKDKLENLAQQFVEQKIPHLLFDIGINKLYEHQKCGHYCILVSASPELYLVKWAQQQGFDAIFGTQFELKNHKFTGQFIGKNCFGSEKVSRINEQLGPECWRNSIAYSDSRVDMPMLKQVTSGYLLEDDKFVMVK